MWIRIAEKTSIKYISTQLIAYRIHSAQLSVVRKRRMWEDGFQILRDACMRKHYSFNLIRKRLAVLNYRIFQCEYGEKHYILAFLRLLVSAIFDPCRCLKVVFRGQWSITE